MSEKSEANEQLVRTSLAGLNFNGTAHSCGPRAIGPALGTCVSGHASKNIMVCPRKIKTGASVKKSV